MSRIVFAPDSFKGSIGAADAAAALAAGWRSVRPSDGIRLLPLADGGEGTLDAIGAAVAGARRMPVTVHGPDNRRVDASWLLLPGAEGEPGGVEGGIGVVELGNTSGIQLLDELAPLDAHTLGFGEAIAAALDAGVHRLLLAIGSSASSDGGAGALVALGASITDAAARPIRLGNRGLGTAARVDLTRLRPVPPGGAVVLSDVTSPLLGPSGAAAVFGPQKGADPAVVEGLESNLARWARLLERAAAPGRVDADAAGAGAAGGTGFGMLAWGATIEAGSRAVGEAVGAREAFAGASLVITGEGRFDDQSRVGKVPSSVLEGAGSVPVALVAGLIAGDVDDFALTIALTDLAGGIAEAMADPARWLREAGALLARDARI